MKNKEIFNTAKIKGSQAQFSVYNNKLMQKILARLMIQYFFQTINRVKFVK